LIKPKNYYYKDIATNIVSMSNPKRSSQTKISGILRSHKGIMHAASAQMFFPMQTRFGAEVTAPDDLSAGRMVNSTI